MLEKYGVEREDVYEAIRLEIRKSPLFRFNWFIKSRNVAVMQFFYVIRKFLVAVKP